MEAHEGLGWCCPHDRGSHAPAHRHPRSALQPNCPACRPPEHCRTHPRCRDSQAGRAEQQSGSQAGAPAGPAALRRPRPKSRCSCAGACARRGQKLRLGCAKHIRAAPLPPAPNTHIHSSMACPPSRKAGRLPTAAVALAGASVAEASAGCCQGTPMICNQAPRCAPATSGAPVLAAYCCAWLKAAARAGRRKASQLSAAANANGESKQLPPSHPSPVLARTGRVAAACRKVVCHTWRRARARNAGWAVCALQHAGHAARPLQLLDTTLRLHQALHTGWPCVCPVLRCK